MNRNHDLSNLKFLRGHSDFFNDTVGLDIIGQYNYELGKNKTWLEGIGVIDLQNRINILD